MPPHIMSKPVYHRPREINLQLLPPQLKMLIRIMGERDALRLVEERGGTPMTVPVQVSDQHWLANIVSPAAFVALVSEMARVTIELPKNDSIVLQWRHQQVLKLKRTGLTLAEIAVRTGYSRRWVIKILKGEAESSAQLDLFAAPIEVLACNPERLGPSANDPFGAMACKAV